MTDPIEEAILLLTRQWMTYVGLDHHKDRDCHFSIEKRWSYGEGATYSAQHHGYIAPYLQGPPRSSYDEARNDLLRFLRSQVEKAISYAHRDIASKADDFWGHDPHEVLRVFGVDQ